jgi:cytoskeletal protein RodZ
MGELGDLLRKAREEKGLSLSQLEEATKIRRVNLQALEDEDYDSLPPPIYVKGFLKSCARYLGLDPQQVLGLYQEPEVTTRGTPAPVILDEPLWPLAPRRWWPVWAGLLVIVVVVAGWWGYQQYYGKVPIVSSTATPTVTSIPPSPTRVPPTATLHPPTASPSPTQTASPSPTTTPTPAGLELRIEIVGSPAWLRIEVDDAEVFVGTLEPGATRRWVANERIVMRCGEAGAARVTLDGQMLGFLGEQGEVVEREWTAPGTPTRTPSA